LASGLDGSWPWFFLLRDAFAVAFAVAFGAEAVTVAFGSVGAAFGFAFAFPADAFGAEAAKDFSVSWKPTGGSSSSEPSDSGSAAAVPAYDHMQQKTKT